MVVVASHVCIVTETYPPEINGVASTLAHLASGMRERGHIVSLVRPRQPSIDVPGRREPRTLRVGGMRLPGYKGLRIGFPAGAALRTVWSRSRPDAVYVATEGPLGWSAARAGAALGIPVYSGFHTNFDRYMQHYGAGWLRRPIAAYLRHFHNATAGTLVSTPRLRDELAAAGFERLGVLGRGVDGRRFEPARRSAALRATWGASDRDLVVLYVGRLAPEKNVELAATAYRAMQKARGGGLRFVVVGDGPLGAALARAYPDLLFCGFRTGEDLAVHYASADARGDGQRSRRGRLRLRRRPCAHRERHHGRAGPARRRTRLRGRRGGARAGATGAAGHASAGARRDGGRRVVACGRTLRGAPVGSRRSRGGRTWRTTCSGEFWDCVSPPRRWWWRGDS